MTSNGINHSIVKAFTLLEYFTSVKPQWGVRELARHLGVHESTMYRMMATLESLGVLYKNPENDKYLLGLKLYDLGHRVKVYDALVQKSHPILLDIAEEIEETVHLGIWHKDEVMMVDKVESEKGLRLNSKIGQSSPIHCTGLGKTLLAFRDEHYIKKLIDEVELNKFTSYTLTTKADLEKELCEIRKNKFALDRQEFELGLICVAVPVFAADGTVVAALSAAGPSDRFKESQLNSYLSILQSGATKIFNKIGSIKLI